jgi:hypothetical protein
MKSIPFSFVLDELADLDPYTKPMFGSLGVYVGEKIVLILRSRESSPADNGLWIATTGEHHESLRTELPSMRSIEVFGPGPTGWQVLPMSAPDFEESAIHMCGLIRKKDSRIGKVPKARKPRGKNASKRKSSKK